MNLVNIKTKIRTQKPTQIFKQGEAVISHLSVSHLHMRNIGVSFWEPLETLPTSPASGLHTRPAVLLCLLSGTFAAFDGAVSLLLLD